MPISGVVILIEPKKSQKIFNALKKTEGVTTYGLHKDIYIVAVFEAKTTKELETMSGHISKEIDGVLGVYPTYLHFEDETEEA
ncbi:chaperone NapD [candidate division KSB1 bacterium]|nr:chaperone NapD [candidate division KSB1 bacterium]MBL7094672.1 chaperone NapD [candidate division KSB1 bacterium]